MIKLNPSIQVFIFYLSNLWYWFIFHFCMTSFALYYYIADAPKEPAYITLKRSVELKVLFDIGDIFVLLNLQHFTLGVVSLWKEHPNCYLHISQTLRWGEMSGLPPSWLRPRSISFKNKLIPWRRKEKRLGGGELANLSRASTNPVRTKLRHLHHSAMAPGMPQNSTGNHQYDQQRMKKTKTPQNPNNQTLL